MPRRKSKGFTLVELVTVIMILGIVSAGIGGFVVTGTRIFIDSGLTDQVLSESRYALQRMTREIKAALPNSIRISRDNQLQCIEFVPTKTSSAYLSVSFTESGASQLGTVFRNADNNLIAAEDRMYIYPTSAAEVYRTGAGFGLSKYAEIQTVSSDPDEIGLFYKQPVIFAEKSPSRRAYFVHQPVSYCVNGITDQLIRYAGYGFEVIQPMTFADDKGSLLATNIVNNISAADLMFQYTPSSLVNNAVVQLTPRFSIDGQSIQYQHQVQVINVP